jgi:hypothetical protein
LLNQKGQIRMIEAFLSVAVIFSAMLISITFPSSPNLSKQNQLANLGTQALAKLDSNGALGSFIVQENWTAMRQSLDALLPVGISFNLTIYDEDLSPINNQTIQNTGLLGREAVSVQYVCATQAKNMQFFLLRLQLAWRG